MTNPVRPEGGFSPEPLARRGFPYLKLKEVSGDTNVDKNIFDPPGQRLKRIDALFNGLNVFKYFAYSYPGRGPNYGDAILMTDLAWMMTKLHRVNPDQDLVITQEDFDAKIGDLEPNLSSRSRIHVEVLKKKPLDPSIDHAQARLKRNREILSLIDNDLQASIKDTADRVLGSKRQHWPKDLEREEIDPTETVFLDTFMDAFPILSHEIKNKLTSVKGFCQLIEKSSNARALEIIKNSFASLDQTLDEFYSMLVAYRSEPVLDTNKRIPVTKETITGEQLEASLELNVLKHLLPNNIGLNGPTISDDLSQVNFTWSNRWMTDFFENIGQNLVKAYVAKAKQAVANKISKTRAFEPNLVNIRMGLAEGGSLVVVIDDNGKGLDLNILLHGFQKEKTTWETDLASEEAPEEPYEVSEEIQKLAQTEVSGTGLGMDNQVKIAQEYGIQIIGENILKDKVINGKVVGQELEGARIILVIPLKRPSDIEPLPGNS